jgi:hypothetical protein
MELYSRFVRFQWSLWIFKSIINSKKTAISIKTNTDFAPHNKLTANTITEYRSKPGSENRFD